MRSNFADLLVPFFVCDPENDSLLSFSTPSRSFFVPCHTDRSQSPVHSLPPSPFDIRPGNSELCRALKSPKTVDILDVSYIRCLRARCGNLDDRVLESVLGHPVKSMSEIVMQRATFPIRRR
jgi:hypothetical protein